MTDIDTADLEGIAVKVWTTGDWEWEIPLEEYHSHYFTTNFVWVNSIEGDRSAFAVHNIRHIWFSSEVQ